MKNLAIFDANNLLHRTLWIVRYISKNKVLFSNLEDKELFINKFSIDINHIIKNYFQNFDIIFAFDSKSWRKKILIEGEGYKHNRKESFEDDSINWNVFWEIVEEIRQNFEEYFLVLKQKNAEADDLIYLTIEKFNNSKYKNKIIVSADTDLLQCLRFENVFQFSPLNKKLFVNKNYIFEENSNDLFNISFEKNIVEIFIENNIKIEKMDPQIELLKKLIKGDKSDNIKPVLQRVVFNEKLVNYFYDNIKNIENLKNNEYSTKLLKYINKGKNIEPNLLENFNNNYLIICLDRNNIPNEIINEFNNIIFDFSNKKKFTISKTKSQEKINVFSDFYNLLK
jgi:hypothetical protein